MSDPKKQTFLILCVPETFLWQQKNPTNIDCLVLSSSFNLLNFFCNTDLLKLRSFSHLPSRDSYLSLGVTQTFFSALPEVFLEVPTSQDCLVSLDIKILGHPWPEFVSSVCSVALSNISFPWEQLQMAVAVDGQEGHILGRHKHNFFTFHKKNLTHYTWQVNIGVTSLVIGPTKKYASWSSKKLETPFKVP